MFRPAMIVAMSTSTSHLRKPSLVMVRSYLPRKYKKPKTEPSMGHLQLADKNDWFKNFNKSIESPSQRPYQ